MSEGFPIQAQSQTVWQQQSETRIEPELMLQHKKDFAYALLKNPESSFEAALQVFPKDRALALKVSNIWPNDHQVIDFCRDLLEEFGEETFLPTKVNFLGKIWTKLNSPYIENKDFAKLSDVYAKIRGFYPEKQTSSSETNINLTGESVKVMMVTNNGTDEEWERKIAVQQQNLLADEC